MKKIILLTGSVCLAAMLLLAFKSTPLPASKTEQMVADWERAKAYTKEYLDAATEEAYSFKAMPEMRSFGEQMLHLSEVNYNLTASTTGKKSPFDWGKLEKSNELKTKAAITKAVLDSYDYVIASVKEMDDAKLAGTVKIFDFSMTREVAFGKTFEHQTHHRGQTTVYLRLKGITPPNEKLF